MSTFGEYFRVTTYGESHCRSVGCIIDGCPPGLCLTEADIQPQLRRRRPGQSAITTPRDEQDEVTIHSGTERGVTLGTPIALAVLNLDQRPADYAGGSGNPVVDMYPRPSHADWTYLEKYGVKASSGGGRSSARETIARVAAGAVAEKYLSLAYGIEIVAFVDSVGPIRLFNSPITAASGEGSTAGGGGGYASSPRFQSFLHSITRTNVDTFLPVRCPDAAVAGDMERLISATRDARDSIGGTVTCIVRHVPTGLGEPAFDKFQAMLAHAMLSIPATKGFEIGSGFAGSEMLGSKHNDAFVSVASDAEVDTKGGGMATAMPAAVAHSGASRVGLPRPRLTTRTNNSGGVQGGITNGTPIYFRVAFKPPATIGQDQTTASYDGSVEGVLAAKGRHDPCVVPRAVPIVEAMTALVVIDLLMAQQSRNMARQLLPPLKK